jgi:hypothetical protein
MAKQKLTNEQRGTLLEWLAADYDWRLIKKWFDERQWPELSRNTISYYRKSRNIDIEQLRGDRRLKALYTGLALKSERIARLTRHADELEAIKWEPDEHGRLWNEKAWRETLGEIAAEVGDRKQGIVFSWRDEAKAQGYDPDKLVEEFARAMVTANLEGSAGESQEPKPDNSNPTSA